MCRNSLNIGKNRHFVQFRGYTYSDMENDLQMFAEMFCGYMKLNVLGKTADKRNLYHVKIGNENAREKVLIFAGIHGREYMTSQLVMEQTSEFLRHLSCREETYKGHVYGELLADKEIHILPMANPDGVTISQFGAEGMLTETVQNQVWDIARRDGARMPWKSYFRHWKANGEGIDVNRNFDACWEGYVDGIGRPSSEKYKGKAPECTKEASVLAELTRKERFSRTISYHSSGSVIYWSFGQKGKLAMDTKQFAERIAQVTGYEPDGNFEELDPAGYKDWALLKERIPSLTIEVGLGDSPLSPGEFKRILRENRFVWEETLLDIEESDKKADLEPDK